MSKCTIVHSKPDNADVDDDDRVARQHVAVTLFGQSRNFQNNSLEVQTPATNTNDPRRQSSTSASSPVDDALLP